MIWILLTLTFIAWALAVTAILLWVRERVAISGLGVAHARIDVAALALLHFLEDTVRGPEEPVGIDLACSSTPLAEALRDKLAALEAALRGEAR